MAVEAENIEKSGRFELVKILAADLSKGNLELPSFPDVVVRIKKALADDNVTVDKIVQIIGADPVLAARILSMSNSAALGPVGNPISDLPTAVNRIGHNMVRNTAVSHGISQSKQSVELESAGKYLQSLWDEASHVAALCFVLTRKFTKLNPDEALLVGLMHTIGKLYIVSKAQQHPQLFDDQADLNAIMDEWHTQIGCSIVANWEFGEHVTEAIENYLDLERQVDGAASYTDVLTLATLLRQILIADDLEIQLESVPAVQQFSIGTADFMPILAESKDHIRSLQHALGK